MQVTSNAELLAYRDRYAELLDKASFSPLLVPGIDQLVSIVETDGKYLSEDETCIMVFEVWIEHGKRLMEISRVVSKGKINFFKLTKYIKDLTEELQIDSLSLVFDNYTFKRLLDRRFNNHKSVTYGIHKISLEE